MRKPTDHEKLLLQVYNTHPLPPYLNALFIPDSSDDLDTNLTDLGEVWLHHTDILQDLDNTLTHTHTCVLKNKKTSHTKTENISVSANNAEQQCLQKIERETQTGSIHPRAPVQSAQVLDLYFQGRNFRKVHGFVVIRESFLHKNRLFHQFAKVFSLESFPLYSIQKNHM